MKIIVLTCGSKALVDDEDYEKVNQLRWHIQKKGNNSYARAVDSDGRFIRMHQFITDGKYERIDHMDKNGLNNQKSNFRYCSHAENMRNSRMHKDNKNGFKGVEFDKRKNRWRAQIKCNGKRYRGKRFMTKEEAAMDYNRLALIHHGEFASLNSLN